jgi:four helix bundle protein
MPTTSFTQLKVWQVAHALVLDVYALARKFPVEERFELASQMRRSAVSVPANVAEGFGRDRSRDKARFYTMSKGSVEELRYYFILARALNYLDDVEPYFARLDSLGRMLRRLIQVTLTQA